MKSSDVVNHFVKAGIAQRTVYNTLDRRNKGISTSEAKRPGRPLSFNSSMNSKLKRLVNNRKGVSQNRLARKFGKSQSTK